MYFYIIWVVHPNGVRDVLTCDRVDSYECMHGLEFELPEGAEPVMEHGTLH